jgi:hypothetical protein
MPEFELNRPPTKYQIESAKARGFKTKARSAPFNELSLFAQAFVEACFFVNGDDDSNRDENSLNKLGAGRLTRKACARIAEYCDKFESDFAELLEFACENDANADSQYDLESAGRDLYFTSKHHGVGFWSREQLRRDLPESLKESFVLAHPHIWRHAESTSIGDVLTACANAMGELYVMSSHGWVDAF